MDKLHKVTSLLLFTLSLCCTKIGYAETPSKPLWTPEDVVTLPAVTPQDIASDGKHTLIQVSYTSLKDNKAEQFSEWMLVDNETLKKQNIGQLNQSYPQLQFIGDGKIFSYILYNEKDKNPLSW